MRKIRRNKPIVSSSTNDKFYEETNTGGLPATLKLNNVVDGRNFIIS